MKNTILAIVTLAVLGCHAQYKTMLHARITPTNSVVVDIPEWAKSDVPPVSEDGTLDYNALTNKPSINGTALVGDVSIPVMTTNDVCNIVTNEVTVGFTEWTFHCDVPAIQEALNSHVFESITETADGTLEFRYMPAVDVYGEGGLIGEAELDDGSQLSATFYPYYYHTDGTEIPVTATRSRITRNRLGLAMLKDLEPLATYKAVTNMASDVLKEASDAALLAIYYPEGNVTSIDQITTEGLEYSYDDATMTATLTSGFNATGDIVIPWRVMKDGKEYKVTAIGESAFYKNTSKISSVAAPITVTSISRGAFFACKALKSVSLPSVMTIGDSAFYSCESLGSVNIPSVTSIGRGAFYGCNPLGSVNLPLVTNIMEYAFEECSSLTSIDFGTTPRNTVPTLGQGAFNSAATSRKFIIPLGMYDEWIEADRWKDLYAEGIYKFMGYADAGEIMNGAAVSNIVDEATANHVKSNDMASAIAPINNNVNTIWTYVYGESVWIAVTNYMRTIGGVAPSFQLFEVRDGKTNLVYWSAEEIDTRVGDKITVAMSNIVDTVVTAKADRAWSKYQSMTGADNPQPNDVTIVSTPSVMLSGGYEWQRFVDTGAEVWVLKCNDLITLGADTNAYFRITDLEGETQFAIEKTASKLVDAVPTATGFTTDGNNYFKVTFSGNIQPTIYVSLDLVNSPFVECSATENDYGLTCSWEQDTAANTYTATIAHNAGDGKPSRMFVYGKVLQEGSTVVRHTAPSSFDGGIIIGGVQYSVGTATIDGNTVMTLNSVTRAVSE